MSRKTEIAGRVRDDIRAGRYAPGERLPAVAELCAEFDSSTATVVYGMRILADQGWIVAEQGRGYFVAPTSPRQDAAGVVEAIDQAMEALRLARTRLLDLNRSPGGVRR